MKAAKATRKSKPQRFAMALAGILLASSGWSLVRPPDGAVLPDFDLRTTPKGLVLGASPSLQARAAEYKPSAARQAALATLRAATGKDVVARWNSANGMPKMLYARDGFLSPADARDGALIARDFLSSHRDLFGFNDAALASLVETRRLLSRDHKTRMIHFTQELQGVPVLHGLVSFALTEEGRVAEVTTGFAMNRLAVGLTPTLSVEEALVKAAALSGVALAAPLARVNPTAEKVAVFEQGPLLGAPTAWLMIFPMAGDAARLAWVADVEPTGYAARYMVAVDAVDGTFLWRYNLVNYVATKGDVFDENPDKALQTPSTQNFPDDTVMVVPESPQGWVKPGGSSTIGNNADAKDDNAGDNEATFGVRATATPGPPLWFQPLFTNAWATGSTSNAFIPDRKFSVLQQFYFVNKYHDWMYAYGFDEAAGNFQDDNFGLGGLGVDYVYVDALDCAQPAGPAYCNNGAANYNNANFGTPPDGGHGRGQMYLFVSPFPRRDGGLDGDIIMHELTHGTSHRLIGGPDQAGCLAGFQGGSMGEGWSDFYALAYFNTLNGSNGVLGEYATGNAAVGIRSDNYDAYPACHIFSGANFCAPNACAGVVSGCEVHDEGQLWTAVLWEMRKALISNLGSTAAGNDVAMTVVTDGMKLAPCAPTFLDARDAILQADTLDYGGAYHCIIWQAFADRSMGVNASTTGVSDTTPVGDVNVPPECLTTGKVILDLATYGCDADAMLSVADGNAASAPSVTVTSAPTGDSLTVSTTGIGPVYSATFTIKPGAATADAFLQVNDGDTVTATYNDVNPPATVNLAANVDCKADVALALAVQGPGCDSDAPAGWPEALPEVLDAGESLDVHVLVSNNLPNDIQNGQLVLTSTGSPDLVLESAGTVNVGTVERNTGTGKGTPAVASFKITASNLAAPQIANMSFTFSGRGYATSKLPLSLQLPVQKNYVGNDRTTGVQAFEAGAGGYTHLPFPGSGGADEWNLASCAAASGTMSFHAGKADCVSDAAEQDAILLSPTINPYVALTTPSYYPLKLNWNHRLSIGGSGSTSDEFVVILSSPQIDAFVSPYASFTSVDNTPSFTPQSFSFGPADIFNAGLKLNQGMAFWFDFWTTSNSALSKWWDVDDVELTYRTADLTDQVGRSCSVGYYGTLSACTSGTVMLYDTVRLDEAQIAGSGAFWYTSPDWDALDKEFPTAAMVNETVGLVITDNPGGVGHAGTMGVNGRVVTSVPLSSLNYQTTTCAAIPTPVGPAAVIPAGQPITLTWTPYTESGPQKLIKGYNVWRIDAEPYLPGTPTLDNYIASAVLLGTTFAQADINKFVDPAPALTSPPTDSYYYAIQPLLACQSPGVGSCAANGTFALTITPLEGNVLNGKENISGDSQVSSGGAPQSGPVQVGAALLAVFSSVKAETTASGVRVSWMTAAEIDTLGYHLYWGTTADEASLVRATPKMISAMGAGYPYVYEGVQPKGAVYFQIREVAATGGPSRSSVFGFGTAHDPTGSSSRRRRGGNLSGSGESLLPGQSSDAAEGRSRGR